MPAILRTNRQIHNEASEVLYEQNRLAIITFDTKSWALLFKEGIQFPDVRVGPGHFESFFPLIRLKHGRIGGLPMLTMDMTIRCEHDTPSTNEVANAEEANKRMVFIGFLSAVYAMCRHLTLFESADQLQLAVRLEKPVGKSIQEEILFPFGDVRGIGRAIITSVQLSFPTELTTFMETPIVHPNEILERQKVYESRARRQMRVQRWSEARDTLEYALKALRNSCNSRRKLSGFDMGKAHEFNVMEGGLKSMYDECGIKLGRKLEMHKGVWF